MLKKVLKIFLIISFLSLALLVGAMFLTKFMKKAIMKAEREVPNLVEYMTPKVISSQEMTEKISKKLKKKGKVYSKEYQKAAQGIIDKLKKGKKYTLDSPLLIMNPFGTNKTGLYIYFKHGFRVNTNYTVSIKKADAPEELGTPDFSAQMHTNSSNLPLAEQEGQIIGLMAGVKNYVAVYLYDENQELVAKAGYILDLPADREPMIEKLETEHNRELEQLSEGLFAVFGLFSEKEKRSLPFYDSRGILRARLRLDKGAKDVNLKSIDGKLFYAIDSRRYALVTKTGKVDKIYDLGKGYRSFGDFDFTPANRYMLTFSQHQNQGNFLSCIDLYDGKSSIILNLEDLFVEKGRTLDFTSLRILNDNDVLISEKTTSSLIRLNNVFRRPEVKMVLTPEGTPVVGNQTEIRYEKQGDFPPHLLQNAVFMDRGQKMKQRTYHIQVLNNKGGNGEAKLYDYLIDEGNRSYSLSSSIDLPYAAENGGLGKNGSNTISSLGAAGTFFEYNKEGNLLSTYKMKNETFSKVLKFDMKGSWFTK